MPIYRGISAYWPFHLWSITSTSEGTRAEISLYRASGGFSISRADLVRSPNRPRSQLQQRLRSFRVASNAPVCNTTSPDKCPDRLRRLFSPQYYSIDDQNKTTTACEYSWSLYPRQFDAPMNSSSAEGRLRRLHAAIVSMASAAGLLIRCRSSLLPIRSPAL